MCATNNNYKQRDVLNGNHYELEMYELMFENNEKKDIDEGFSYVDSTAGKEVEDEDDLWHEIQMNRQMVIKKKIDEYVNSFTVHGLTKVFTGTKIESLFWLIMLCGGILLSTIVVHGLVTKFLKYGIYTEIRAQITDQNYFPSITFCENRLLSDKYFSYCGVPPRIKHSNHSIVCGHKNPNMKVNITAKNNKFWSNGIFNVTKCETWGGKTCANNKYFKSLDHFNHSCITWNYDGTLHDIYSHTDIEFSFTAPPALNQVPVIIAIPHDPAILEIDITNKVDIEPFKHYEIKLDKTVIKRLPKPFPSNCTKEKKGDIFPGKYTRRSCIESHNYIEMYKECGDTLDYIKQFIPDHIKKDYQQNRTIRKTEECIWMFGQGEAKKSIACAFPCEDLDLGIISTFHERNNRKTGNNSLYIVSLQYQRVDTYKVMEEKELYSWDQMACEIGGLVGLVIGASVISLVEILAYIFLILVKQFV